MLRIYFFLTDSSKVELPGFISNSYELQYSIWGFMLQDYEKHCGAKVKLLWKITHAAHTHGDECEPLPFSIGELKTAAERLEELKALYLTGEKVEYLPGMIFQEKDADLDDFHTIDVDMDNQSLAQIIDIILEIWYAAIEEGIPFRSYLYAK